MCVIYACHSQLPSRDELLAGSNRNEDGAGICWLDKLGGKNPKVRWKKGLKSNPEAVLSFIKDNQIPFPLGIHYRTASIGGVCDELTHPFPIDVELPSDNEGSTRRVLMHNGHMGDWKDWFTKITFAQNDFQFPLGPWSDSRALAAVVALRGEGIIEIVSGSSRVMVLDSIPSLGYDKNDPQSYIRLFGSWINKEGYSQSCETKSQTVLCYRGSGGRVRTGHATETDSRFPRSGLVSSGSSQENTWTIDELEALIEDIRKEQNEARLLLGA